MKEKKFSILILLPIVLFVIMVLKAHFFNDKVALSKKDYVDLDIKRVEKYKNALILKDTIAIFQNTERIFPSGHQHFYQNYYRYFESIKAPYHLFKDVGCDTLKVIKNKDTLFYKLHPF